MMLILIADTFLEQVIRFVRTYIRKTLRLSALHYCVGNLEAVCVAMLFLEMAFLVEIKSGAFPANANTMSVRLLGMIRVCMGMHKA